MKRLLAILPILALGFACPVAQAQFYNTALRVTNAVPAATTNTVNSSVIDVTQNSAFVVQAKFKLDAAGTDVVVLQFQRSADAVNWQNDFSLSITGSGTNTVFGITNITCGAIPYWRLSTVAQPSSANLTNLLVSYGVKRALIENAP